MTPIVAAVGMVTLDHVYEIPHYPEEETQTQVTRFFTALGGPVGKGALAARRLGAEVRVLATCGEDDQADRLEALLRSEDVNAHLVRLPQASQQSAVVLVGGGSSRTILWLPQPMANDVIISRIPSVIDGADVVLLDCTDERLALATVQTAREMGIPTVVDTGSGRPWVPAVIAKADHVIFPEKYLQGRGIDVTIHSLNSLDTPQGRPLTAVTIGERGGLYVAKGGHRGGWHAGRAHAVDTCGSGDTFHGAYAWAIAAGSSVHDAIELSAWAAAMKVEQYGNQGMPSAEALRERMSGEAGLVREGDDLVY